MTMINWRSIKEVGVPKDDTISYLVTDGDDISTSGIEYSKNYGTGVTHFIRWSGDQNTWEDNQCCSGTPIFDLIPTHWCPITELNLPKNKKQ